jgi:hypothetical protein
VQAADLSAELAAPSLAAPSLAATALAPNNEAFQKLLLRARVQLGMAPGELFNQTDLLQVVRRSASGQAGGRHSMCRGPFWWSRHWKV